MKREDLEWLESIFNQAKMICDPIEYDHRQKVLLYALAKFLLKELDDMREAEKDSSEPQS